MTDDKPSSSSAPLIAPAPAATASRTVMTIDVNDPARFLNRDIEWLEFNARVLDIAADARTPLLERLRFLSIYSANLDEFFMKRVGVLKRQIEAGVSGPVPEALTPVQQLDGIRARVATLAHRQAIILRDRVMPALVPHGCFWSNWSFGRCGASKLWVSSKTL
jgi:polyphosphate kinase